MSYVDSEVVFRARCEEIKLTAQTIDALKDKGWSTFGSYAFSVTTNPAQLSDDDFDAKVSGPVLGNARHPEAALLRRLLFESYTLTATELRRKTDSTESDGPKKLPVQEIASRFEALEKKLSPIKVESVLEPSHGLINALAQCFEDGRLRYIEWSKCTSRSLELNNVKEHGSLKVWKADSSGTIKQADSDHDLKCDANTELEVFNALKRRGIAFELAKLMSFEAHEKITSLLFSELQRDPIDGFRKISMSQLASADREIHLRLAELTRAGLPLGTSGELPLDKHIDKVLQLPSVMWLLMPKPKTTPEKAAPSAPATAPPKRTTPTPKYQPKGNKFDKSKIRKTKTPMPLQLRGGTPIDAEGKAICYGFNLGEGLGNSADCKRAPFLLELFCGTAGVCAQFRTLGGKALGVDHHLNRARLKSAAVKLDLTQQWVQELICREISLGRVDAVHLGPPCGTASRARNIPIRKKLRRAGAPNPQPLRSERFPEGLPWIKGVNRLKLRAANTLYSFAARIVVLCEKHQVLVTVENPSRSYMWLTKYWKDLIPRYFFNIIDSCMYGSDHKKETAFLSSFFPPRLQQRCTGDHIHKEWRVTRSEDGQWKFDTAKEAEYPTKLARELAAAFMDELMKSDKFVLQDQLSDHAAKIASVTQPRRTRGPLLLSEFKCKVQIQCLVHDDPPEIICNDALPPFQGIPIGSKRVDIQPVMNADGKGGEGRLVTYGVFFSPDEFIQRALQIVHPFDIPLPFDSANMEAISFILREGPAEVAKFRADKLNHYIDRAKSLRENEARLHESLEPSLKPILASKRLLLFKEMLIDAQVDDPELFHDICSGFKLVGDIQPSGQFQKQLKPASLHVEQLRQTAMWAQKAVVASCKKCSEDPEVARAVWDETLEQCMEDKQWVRGPFTADEISQRNGDQWIPSRRFGVKQGEKIRAVDDFSQYLINSTVTSHEKIDLEGIDHICSTARFFLGASSDDGRWYIPSEGDDMSGQVNFGWGAEGSKDLHGRCLDLRQAYKQLVRHPDDSWASILAVYCPDDAKVYFFEAVALPFGSISSVLAFNRAARALRTILSRTFRLVVTNFFDDFCQLELGMLCDSAWKCAETVMGLLGWRISTGDDKRKPFAKSFEILGAVVSFKGGLIEVSNKETRLQQVELQTTELRKHLGQMVSRSMLESLKGRLLYAAGHTYGRCTQLACQLLHRFGGQGASVRVTPELVHATASALEVLMRAKPRRVEPWSHCPPLLVFTDGAVEELGARVTHGALMIDPLTGQSSVFGDHVPNEFSSVWSRHGKKQVICQAEMLPVLVAKCTWKQNMTGRSILWFLDNEAARMSFVRNFSPVIDNFFCFK
eukprot:s3880_g2.t1